MDPSPAAAPLQPMTPDRVNQQSGYFNSPSKSPDRDSKIHDRIAQFNSMTSQHGFSNSMSKQLERKTADAALKRAMLGREEAESEMRKYRDEARSLRKLVEEGRERERRVGERLETVMENYGRAKETYAHTQALWEKEIRKARKETFKTQSSTVKLQEELKAARTAAKATDEALQHEKERSKAHEQEAFETRYQVVSIQEQLQQALDRITAVEQERDALRTLAQNEEAARIAAEGRLQLPQPPKADDQPASAKKPPRISLSTADIMFPPASEADIDELTRLWQWEKQRADRTQEHVEFLEAECELRCCSCAPKPSRSRRSVGSSRRSRGEAVPIVDPADLVILGQGPIPQRQSTTPTDEPVMHQERDTEMEDAPDSRDEQHVAAPAAAAAPMTRKVSRRSTVFVPSEGIFRTLSQEVLEPIEPVKEASPEPPAAAEPTRGMHYSRTPSAEPPTFATAGNECTSLLSLLNAPRQDDSHGMMFNIPTTPAGEPTHRQMMGRHNDETAPEPPRGRSPAERANSDAPGQPHPSNNFYTVTTTVSVPVGESKQSSREYVNGFTRSQNRAPSFDINNPALTPTMTREEALAQIRERRGRARSGAATPRRQMVTGKGLRRDASAPAGRVTKSRRS